MPKVLQHIHRTTRYRIRLRKIREVNRIFDTSSRGTSVAIQPSWRLLRRLVVRLEVHRITILIATTLTFLLLVQMFFYWLQSGGATRAAAIVENTIRPSRYKDPKEIAPRLIELQNRGIVDCLKMRVSGQVLFDRTDQSNCDAPEWSLYGAKHSVRVQGESGREWHLTFRSPNDRTFHLSLWVMRLSGSFLMLMGIGLIYYISDKMQKALLQARIERDWLWRQAQQVRHDVASPISALRVATQFPGLRPQYKEFLEKLLNRTEEIFSDLAKTPLPEGFSKELFSASEAIADVVREKQNPRIQMSLDSVQLWGSRRDFCRAISNLLNNALEATSDGLVRVHLAQSFAGICLEISDEGPGFPVEIIKHGPRRGVSLLKDGGSGLGLYQARMAVKAMGGEIFIANGERGHGARVALTFPNRSSQMQTVHLSPVLFK